MCSHYNLVAAVDEVDIDLVDALREAPIRQHGNKLAIRKCVKPSNTYKPCKLFNTINNPHKTEFSTYAAMKPIIHVLPIIVANLMYRTNRNLSWRWFIFSRANREDLETLVILIAVNINKPVVMNEWMKMNVIKY